MSILLTWGIFMHAFSDLVDRCTAFTLAALDDAMEKAVEGMQTTGSTSLVRGLQTLQLQMAISAVGMFSIFDAMLQDQLQVADGFVEATRLLEQESEPSLRERFEDFRLAVNVLKHGRGRSYDALVAREARLSFRVKLPGEAFFYEGDVSEISTLVEVDDKFLQSCAELIHAVSVVIRRARPDFTG